MCDQWVDEGKENKTIRFEINLIYRYFFEHPDNFNLRKKQVCSQNVELSTKTHILTLKLNHLNI